MVASPWVRVESTACSTAVRSSERTPPIQTWISTELVVRMVCSLVGAASWACVGVVQWRESSSCSCSCSIMRRAIWSLGDNIKVISCFFLVFALKLLEHEPLIFIYGEGVLWTYVAADYALIDVRLKILLWYYSTCVYRGRCTSSTLQQCPNAIACSRSYTKYSCPCSCTFEGIPFPSSLLSLVVTLAKNTF